MTFFTILAVLWLVINVANLGFAIADFRRNRRNDRIRHATSLRIAPRTSRG